jgi:hypothetical protein
MDATGLQALEDLHLKLKKKGKHLILSAPHTQPLAVMINSGFIDRLGEENVCPDIGAALARAREILGLPAVEEITDTPEALRAEKKQIEAARQELSDAVQRASRMLKKRDGREKQPTGPGP